MVCAIFLPS